MNSFVKAATYDANLKHTENGALAHRHLNDSVLELFASIGAMRPRSEFEIQQKFLSAYNENPELTTKMLFYAGNVRGGLGERRTFRICLKALANKNPKVIIDNLDNIGFYNRYDSLFELVDTPVEKYMWEYVSHTLLEDLMAAKANKSCSLLAKWMPSEKASSEKTRKLAFKAMHALEVNERKYRKMLSMLRKHIKVVEADMSQNKWASIDYEGVPSKAMANYNAAFAKHDPIGFGQYKQALEKGEKKINASTLFPYELVKNYMGYHPDTNAMAEQQWKALPNYVEGENNIIVMADVSGSMSGRPMETSVGLALYFAERNKGAFKNLYMTFTSSPYFIQVNPNDTLAKKVMDCRQKGVGFSTNLEAAFQKILDTAVENHVPAKDMPKALVVISDMEIDKYMRPTDYWGRSMKWDFVDTMRARFARHGYELPIMIMWNVEARQDTYLSTRDDVIFVSGQSPSVFKSFLGALNGKTGYDVMVETLNAPMYDRVVTESC